jgi:hypothetical protein
MPFRVPSLSFTSCAAAEEGKLSFADDSFSFLRHRKFFSPIVCGSDGGGGGGGGEKVLIRTRSIAFFGLILA